MRALLDDAALVHDNQAVRPPEGGQAVRDRNGRAIRDQTVQRLLDQRLGLRVDAAGGLVENQHARVVQDRPGDADPLALAPGECLPALADGCVVPVREADDEVVGVGRPGGGDNLLQRRGGLAVGDVLAHRAVEEERFLQDDPDAGPQRIQVVVSHVHAVDADPPVGGVVEAADEIDHRRLARPRRSRQPDHLARLDREVHVLQHATDAVVAEADVVQFDSPANVHAGTGGGPREDGRLGVEHLEDPLRASRRPVEHLVHVRDAVHGAVEHVQVPDEGQQFADRHGRGLSPGRRMVEAVDDPPAPHQPDQHDAHLRAELHQGAKRGEHADQTQRLAVHLFVLVAEAVDLAVFLAEGLDHAHAGQGAGDDGGHLAPAVEQAPEPAVEFLVEDDHQKHHDRDGPQDDKGQLPVQQEQRDADACDRQDGHDHFDEGEGHEIPQAFRVGRDARHEAARLLAGEETQGKLVQVAVDGVAQVAADVGAHRGQDPLLDGLPDQQDDEQPRHQPNVEEEQRGVRIAAGAGAEPLVDQRLAQPGQDQPDTRRDQREDGARDGPGLVGPDEVEHAEEDLPAARAGGAVLAPGRDHPPARLAAELLVLRRGVFVGRLDVLGPLDPLLQAPLQPPDAPGVAKREAELPRHLPVGQQAQQVHPEALDDLRLIEAFRGQPPAPPLAVAPGEVPDPPIRQDEVPLHVHAVVVEVELRRGQDGLPAGLQHDPLTKIVRQVVDVAVRVVPGVRHDSRT